MATGSSWKADYEIEFLKEKHAVSKRATTVVTPKERKIQTREEMERRKREMEDKLRRYMNAKEGKPEKVTPALPEDYGQW